MEKESKINNENNLITLKEASSISGYSPDYIGQLIRSGKISGKQVYYNVAWMTTAKDVLSYKKNSENNNKTGIKDALSTKSRRIMLEFNILKLFFKNFRKSLPIFIILILCFLLLNIFIFYNLTNKEKQTDSLNKNKNNTQEFFSF